MNSEPFTEQRITLRNELRGELRGDPGIHQPLSPIITVPAVPLPHGFVTLFQTIETLRTTQHGFAIQFVAVAAGAGTTTIAAGFAQAAAQSYRQPVLLISAVAPSGVISPLPTDTTWLFHARVEPLLSGFTDRPGLTFEERLTELRKDFRAIVIDCPALGTAPHAITIARHCDGTALIAAASRTSARDLVTARDTITRVGGQVLGAVFNRERSYRPAWLGGRG